MSNLEDPLSRLTIEANGTKAEQSIKLVPCSFSFHSFTASLNDSPYNYHTMLMDNSLFVWIGNNNQMSNVALSMLLTASKTPTGTVLFGDPADNVSMGIANRLAKRLSKQVFVSYNAEADKALVSSIEKRLLEEIAQHPDKF